MQGIQCMLFLFQSGRKAVHPLHPPSDIAVIIAAYNSGNTIRRAIESALAEPEVAEVIVVDDCSTDDTVQISRLCEDGTGRLKVLSQTVNGGPSVARNRALKEVASSWVTILDADDFFLTGRMAGLLAYAHDADMIADDMYQVSENDIEGPRRLLLGPSVPLPMKVSFADFVLSNVTQRRRERAELGFIKPLIRRDFLRLHHLCYQKNMRLGEDYELYARALGLGARLVVVPAQGYVSVVRSRSLSGNHSEFDLLQLRDCDTALLADLDLSAADRCAIRQHYRSVDCRYQWRMLILAVKDRNIAGAIKTFLRPFPVPFYLLGQVWEQVLLRFSKRKERAV